jgi:hypothetical protein
VVYEIMKRVIVLLFITVFLFILGCKKDFSPLELDLFSFQVGNIYKYHITQLSNNGSLLDYHFYVKITGDTILYDKKYYIFNNSSFQRVENNIHYALSPEGWNEAILFDYNVCEGDSIFHVGVWGIVNLIEWKKIFGVKHKTFKIAYEKNTRRKFKWEYSTKFGRTYYFHDFSNIETFTNVLVGAKIDGIVYGELD